MVLNIIKNITINTLKYKYHLQKLKENGSSFSIAGNIIKSNDRSHNYYVPLRRYNYKQQSNEISNPENTFFFFIRFNGLLFFWI